MSLFVSPFGLVVSTLLVAAAVAEDGGTVDVVVLVDMVSDDGVVGFRVGALEVERPKIFVTRFGFAGDGVGSGSFFVVVSRGTVTAVGLVDVIVSECLLLVDDVDVVLSTVESEVALRGAVPAGLVVVVMDVVVIDSFSVVASVFLSVVV